MDRKLHLHSHLKDGESKKCHKRTEKQSNLQQCNRNQCITLHTCNIGKLWWFKISILPFLPFHTLLISFHLISVFVYYPFLCLRKKKGRQWMEKKTLRMTSTFFSTTIWNCKFSVLFACVSEISAMCSFSSIYSGFNCAFTLAFSVFRKPFLTWDAARRFLSFSLSRYPSLFPIRPI